MVLPRGQEAELAGFFVYCTQILGWLPPLLFSILVENDVDYKYGVIVTSFGFVVSISLLSCTASWPEIVKEAQEGGNAGGEVPNHYSEFEQVEKKLGVLDDAVATGTTKTV